MRCVYSMSIVFFRAHICFMLADRLGRESGQGSVVYISPNVNDNNTAFFVYGFYVYSCMVYTFYLLQDNAP